MALVCSTAAWGLELLQRPGRIALLASDAQQIISELLPLVQEQRASTKDKHPFHKSGAARQLRGLCAGLVAALDGVEPASEQANPAYSVAKRAKYDRDGWSALRGLFPGCEEHVLSFSSAQDLGRLDQVCRHFHGPVLLSPVRSAALRAVRTRHPNVPVDGALVQRSWSAVLRFAARADERARSWTAAHFEEKLDSAIAAHRTPPVRDDNINLGRELGAAESEREGVATITAAMLRDDWDDANAAAPALLRKASQLFRQLSYCRERNKALLGSSGSVFGLIRSLRYSDAAGKTEAAGALWNLAANAENQVSIAAAGAIPPLVELLCDGDATRKTVAAGALWNLALNAENKVSIAAAGAIPPLVELLRDGGAEGRKYAAGALQTLALNAENMVSIAAAGAIPPLVELLRDGDAERRRIASGALRILTFAKSSLAVLALALGAENNDASALRRRIVTIAYC